MDLELMNVLRADVHSLRHVDIKLKSIWESHNSPRLANSTSCVEDEVLVGPPVDPNKYTVSPPDSFTGDSPFTESALEAQSLAKEWQPQCVVGSSDIVACNTAISTNNTSEAYKSRMLNEPCNQRAVDGHKFAQ